MENRKTLIMKVALITFLVTTAVEYGVYRVAALLLYAGDNAVSSNVGDDLRQDIRSAGPQFQNVSVDYFACRRELFAVHPVLLVTGVVGDEKVKNDLEIFIAEMARKRNFNTGLIVQSVNVFKR